MLQVTLAIILGKTVRLLCRLLRRGGTDLPGRAALKLCPELLRTLAKDVQTVAITGTNGKTTSSRMLEEAFAVEQKRCLANRSGANLISGVVTEFLMASTLTGKPKRKFAVIECDEAASKAVFPQLMPKVILVTNLFRDQLDRYGEVTHTLEHLRRGIASVPEAALCLNADCSLTSSLAESLPNRVVWYGVEQNACPSRPLPEISDAIRCIRCQTEYTYDYLTYGHLGGFRCPRCGYRRHPADIAVTRVLEHHADGSAVELRIQGQTHRAEINLPAMYNIYNAAGVVAAASEMGLAVTSAIQALGSFSCGFGRMEQFDLGARGTRMVLVKNPASCNQVLEFLEGLGESFVLGVLLNDRSADGTDVSWVWDANFEILEAMGDRVSRVIVSGSRAWDMYLRIKYAGIPEERIRVEQDYDALVRGIQEEPLPVFLMPTYTAMMDLRKAVLRSCGGAEFWE